MKRIIFFTTIALALATALSGCGDSSSGNANAEPAADPFTSAVLVLAAATSDTDEPRSIDAFTATAPEDTQPMPII